MTFRLHTSDYHEPNTKRRAELDWCLSENRRAFEVVDVWIEGPRARPTFADLLQWARELAAADDLVVIANTDIIIPRDSIEQMNEIVGADDALALTRWDVKGAIAELFDVPFSQDCWVFRGKPKANIVADFFFGIPGCDNRFAHELKQAGYRVINPSRSIKTYHHHQSGVRTKTNHRSNRVPKPYLFLAPTEIGVTADA